MIIDKIKTRTPGKSMGLQLADAAAGAFFNGLETDTFGNTEPRHVQIMAPVVYRHEGILHGYGLKIVPRETFFTLEGDDTEWISEFT